MKTIPLSQGYVALVDDEDFERVNQFKWSLLRSRPKQDKFYARRNIQKGNIQKEVRLHHFILNYYGMVDHKNGNGLDNQKYNLRPANRYQNCWNARKLSKGTSRFKGVHLYKAKNRPSRWRAIIKFYNHKFSLGYYFTEEDAAISYNHAALAYFGEFAVLNLI